MTKDKELNAEVTCFGIIDCQVCVPDHWTDEQILWFTEMANPCGTSAGWQIRREGDKLLCGDPERQPCSDRPGFVHVMLDC